MCFGGGMLSVDFCPCQCRNSIATVTRCFPGAPREVPGYLRSLGQMGLKAGSTLCERRDKQPERINELRDSWQAQLIEQRNESRVTMENVEFRIHFD